MRQTLRRLYLIKELLKEEERYSKIKIPENHDKQRYLLRSLMNVREPRPVSDEFIEVQNEYLLQEIEKVGITALEDLKPIENQLYIWQGDITTLKVDAIVNAANSNMLGCFHPGHKCIDNAIHTFAGVELRIECKTIMECQGHSEETGKAKITKAYNLPSNYIIHTVGPIVYGQLTETHGKLLKSCYTSCLELAEQNNIKSIAFCCISTGEFCFPNREAARIAIKTVKEYLKENNSNINVIFNVFKECDLQLYNTILKEDYI